MPHRLRAALAAGLAAALIPVAAAGAATKAAPTRRSPPCPVLILSAMPLEADPILAVAKVPAAPAWVHGGKGFWAGTVEGTKAVIALTGIGMVNATRMTEAAFAHFKCFSAVVFSGTSGGDFIGDVLVPTRWTSDGKHYLTTSSALLTILRKGLSRPVRLIRSTPTGDPACACDVTGSSGAATPITLPHKPQIEIGGTGLSDDGFGGRAVPCTPQISDVAGCWPCPFPDPQATNQTQTLARSSPPFLQPQWILGYPAASAAPSGNYVSEDNETAAVFAVAAAHGVPFIGFRAASDGGGDPLHLPGFPAQFFVYKQLAANNAAATALAFLAAWPAAHPAAR